MTTIYTTREGDMLNYIAWKFYGSTTNQVVESVLAANRGLADHGAILPGGLEITMPEVSEPMKSQGIRLWD